MEIEDGMMSFKDGAKGHEPRNTVCKSWKRQGNEFSIIEPPAGDSIDTFILAIRLILYF